jgi:hypothetical protein
LIERAKPARGLWYDRFAGCSIKRGVVGWGHGTGGREAKVPF